MTENGTWKSVEQPHCPECDGIELRRQGRVGIWQRLILPQLGLYPWECGLCRKIFLLRQRSRANVPSWDQQSALPARAEVFPGHGVATGRAQPPRVIAPHEAERPRQKAAR